MHFIKISLLQMKSNTWTHPTLLVILFIPALVLTLLLIKKLVLTLLSPNYHPPVIATVYNIHSITSILTPFEANPKILSFLSHHHKELIIHIATNISSNVILNKLANIVSLLDFNIQYNFFL